MAISDLYLQGSLTFIIFWKLFAIFIATALQVFWVFTTQWSGFCSFPLLVFPAILYDDPNKETWRNVCICF